MKNVISSRYEFCAQVSGEDLKTLPNLFIECPPLVCFYLHELADTGWTMKVRQRSHGVAHSMDINQWQIMKSSALSLAGIPRSRVRVMFAQHKTKNAVINFRMPARPIYLELDEVIEDFKQHRFSISNVALPFEAVEVALARAEEDILHQINERRAARLRAAGIKVVPPSAEIVDLTAMLGRLKAV